MSDMLGKINVNYVSGSMVGIDHVQPLTAFALTFHQLLLLGFIHISHSLCDGTWIKWNLMI